MNLFIKVVTRIWISLLILGVVSAIAVSPWWIADYTDEIGVLVYCLIMAPVLIGVILVGTRPFLAWIRS